MGLKDDSSLYSIQLERTFHYQAGLLKILEQKMKMGLVFNPWLLSFLPVSVVPNLFHLLSFRLCVVQNTLCEGKAPGTMWTSLPPHATGHQSMWSIWPPLWHYVLTSAIRT